MILSKNELSKNEFIGKEEIKVLWGTKSPVNYFSIFTNKLGETLIVPAILPSPNDRENKAC